MADEPNRKVFLSWSGPRSKAAAKLFGPWLEDTIQEAQPWFSDIDVEVGAAWFHAIQEAAKTAAVGVLFLTPERAPSPFLLFEAGILATKHVIPLAIGYDDLNSIKAPLVHLQAKAPTKENIRHILGVINKKIGEPMKEAARLDRALEMTWPKLDEGLRAIAAQEPTEPTPKGPNSEEMLKEILGMVRSIDASQAKADWSRRPPRLQPAGGDDSLANARAAFAQHVSGLQEGSLALRFANALRLAAEEERTKSLADASKEP